MGDLNIGHHRNGRNKVRNNFGRVVVVLLELARLCLLLQFVGSAQRTSARSSTSTASSNVLVWLDKVLSQQLDEFLHVRIVLSLHLLFHHFNHTVILLVLVKNLEKS